MDILYLLSINQNLWKVAYELLCLLKSGKGKSLEEIEKELDLIEYKCRPYIHDADRMRENCCDKASCGHGGIADVAMPRFIHTSEEYRQMLSEQEAELPFS